MGSNVEITNYNDYSIDTLEILSKQYMNLPRGKKSSLCSEENTNLFRQGIKLLMEERKKAKGNDENVKKINDKLTKYRNFRDRFQRQIRKLRVKLSNEKDVKFVSDGNLANKIKIEEPKQEPEQVTIENKKEEKSKQNEENEKRYLDFLKEKCEGFLADIKVEEDLNENDIMQIMKKTEYSINYICNYAKKEAPKLNTKINEIQNYYINELNKKIVLIKEEVEKRNGQIFINNIRKDCEKAFESIKKVTSNSSSNYFKYFPNLDERPEKIEKVKQYIEKICEDAKKTSNPNIQMEIEKIKIYYEKMLNKIYKEIENSINQVMQEREERFTKNGLNTININRNGAICKIDGIYFKVSQKEIEDMWKLSRNLKKYNKTLNELLVSRKEISKKILNKIDPTVIACIKHLNDATPTNMNNMAMATNSVRVQNLITHYLMSIVDSEETNKGLEIVYDLKSLSKGNILKRGISYDIKEKIAQKAMNARAEKIARVEGRFKTSIINKLFRKKQTEREYEYVSGRKIKVEKVDPQIDIIRRRVNHITGEPFVEVAR